MLNFFKPLKSFNPTQKIIQCPNCKQSLRVPIKLGKTLLINCNKCNSKFNIQFKHPLSNLFSWNKQQTIQQNISNLKSRFNYLPPKTKRLFWLTIAMIILFIILHVKTPTKEKQIDPPKKTRYIDTDKTLLGV
ncbi:hypothetical protein DID75_01595 [Candidatus Marinamargulisbacteria bacterium SCGC AG-410-N11]|nr:hypothetical protein DID75_01595 [Candidatus Marinamargulisbacteria bacterium SCGC AG-410-N11]